MDRDSTGDGCILNLAQNMRCDIWTQRFWRDKFYPTLQ